VLGGIGVGLYSAVPDAWLEAVGLLLAASTCDLLTAIGVPAVIDGARVVRPGVFGIEVAPECVALQHVVLFSAAVVAWPASNRARAFAIVAATVSYNVLNVIRLASLFVVGTVSPLAFELAHSVFWQLAGLCLMLGGWLVWLRSIRPLQAAPEGGR
jgi:exosortase/archaeosortase family protein